MFQLACATAFAVALVTAAPAAPARTAPAAVAVSAQTTNARVNPLGIDGNDVAFGWALTSTLRGTCQQAYRVQVGRRPGEADVWDSGRTPSVRQTDVQLSPQRPLAPGTRYHWRVRVWDATGRATPWSPPAWFETGLLSEGDWGGARWIGAVDDAPAQPRPLLRAEFTLAKPVKQARLHATAQGVYQVWLNGQPVGNQALAPGWTDYAQRLQVQTFDVTELVRAGGNAMGAALADGWFRGKVGLGWRGVYGQQLAFRALLRVTYEDGSTEDVATGDSWLGAAGPYVQADLQDGEHFDARREMPGWASAGFKAVGWQPVALRSAPTARLVPQPDEPVRRLALMPARTRTASAGGGFIYDVGQNVVGVARVRITGRAGQTVRLRHAEELHRTGPQRGELYTENLRSAAATDRYTFARDETVTYEPRFTQHGFRYIEVSGVDTPPEVSEVSAVVLGSDLPDTGDLKLSQPMLDQLVRNIRWGQRGNFLSIPTDTPARDERLGWTGDIAVFAPTANRLQDTRAFLMKWMDDLRDAQLADGNIPAIVPYPPRGQFRETGVGWSDAFIQVPYAVWRASGDTQILRRNWVAMRRFYDFLHASATADGNLLEEGRASWFSGDWLNLEGVDRLQEHRVIATAYFAENTRMMAEMARALGDTERAEAWAALAARICQAFAQAYRSADGRIALGTQTVYAMALGMGLLWPAERDATAAHYVAKLAADGNHLKTGFLGTPWLLPALTEAGRDDLAMTLLLNEDYPSWGFEIRMGATTMWERWDGIRPDGRFGPVEMNSFNHYAYGAVGDWMFRRLGGLRIREAGYRKVLVAPLVTHPALDAASASLRTPFGVLSSRWQRTRLGLSLELAVPPGIEAELRLPASRPDAVREGAGPAARAAGVRLLPAPAGEVRMQLASGRYRFSVSPGEAIPATGPDRSSRDAHPDGGPTARRTVAPTRRWAGR